MARKNTNPLTPSRCPRCEARLKYSHTPAGEPLFIHPAKPSPDGTYTAALFKCMYSGSVLTLDHLRQLHTLGYIAMGTDDLPTTIPPEKRVTREALIELTALKRARLAEKQHTPVDDIVNGWYRRSDIAIRSMRKKHELH